MQKERQGLKEQSGKAEVRCLECLNRIKVAPKTVDTKCPHCGARYLIYWPSPDIAKIKGVVP